MCAADSITSFTFKLSEPAQDLVSPYGAGADADEDEDMQEAPPAAQEESEAEDSEDEMPISALQARREATNDDDEDEDGDDDEDNEDNEDDNASPQAPERRGEPAAVAGEGDGDARTASSRFWGVSWDRREKKWKAYYRDADGKNRTIGYYDEEEEAARARDQAIRDAGLEGRRKTNAVDAAGALVPKAPGAHNARDRAAVVAPDPARAPTATTSKFWGVSWSKHERRWRAVYTDANGKTRQIGYFDTQEAAAHAVNAAIRRAGLEGRRKTNPVVDGQLVPRVRKAQGHGVKALRKRRREEAAPATPSTRARRR